MTIEAIRERIVVSVKGSTSRTTDLATTWVPLAMSDWSIRTR